MPAEAAAIFALDSASTLLEASLNAAATRSSTISWSDSRLGSIRTLRHSLVPVRVTLTMPPPALPVTSSLASSSWARCRFSCIFCACCISWAILPRIGSVLVYGSDGIRHDAGAVLFDQAAYRRVVEEGLLGRGLARTALAVHALVKGLGRRLAGLDHDLRRRAQLPGQGLGQCAHRALGAQVFEARVQGQGQHAIDMADEGGVGRQLPGRAAELAGGDALQPVLGIGDHRTTGRRARRCGCGDLRCRRSDRFGPRL